MQFLQDCGAILMVFYNYVVALPERALQSRTKHKQSQTQSGLYIILSTHMPWILKTYNLKFLFPYF